MLLAGQGARERASEWTKPGRWSRRDARLKLPARPQRYASRGGLKLEGALEDFGVTPQDKICLDMGSSTGGFTDCLLQQREASLCGGCHDRSTRLEAAEGSTGGDGRAKCALSAAGGYRRAGRSRDNGRLVYFRDESSSGNRAAGEAWRRFSHSRQAAVRARKAAKSARAESSATPRSTKRRSSERDSAAAALGLEILGVHAQPHNRRRRKSGVFPPRPPQRLE